MPAPWSARRPCLQLLVAAARSARLRALAFDLAAPTDVLSEAARDLGLSASLGLEGSP